MTIATLLKDTRRRMGHRIDRTVARVLSDGLSRTYGVSTVQRDHWLAHMCRDLYELYCLNAELRKGSETVLCGAEANSGLPIRVGLLGLWETGQRNTLPFFQHIVFGQCPAESEMIEAFPLWQLRRRAQALAGQVDLLVVEANRRLLWKPTQGDWALGPADVRMVFDYHPGETWEQTEQRMKGMRRKIKKIHNQGFCYRTSRSDVDFSWFYHRFYVPMVESRFKDYGDINHEEGLRKVFHEAGELLFIEDGHGCTVSGVFEYIKNGVLFSLVAGVRDGDRDLVQQGALVAMNYFSLRHGFELGCRRHDAGVCLPYATDGIYQHKRLWGYQPIPNAWRPHVQLTWTACASPAALAWMRANPFLPQLVSWGGENLRGVYENREVYSPSGGSLSDASMN